MEYRALSDLDVRVPRFLLKWGLCRVMPGVVQAIRRHDPRQRHCFGCQLVSINCFKKIFLKDATGADALVETEAMTNPKLLVAHGRAIIKSEEIQGRIQEIRGQKVIIDTDLARFYGVETRRLNEQVRRNKDKFPADFIFPLTYQEVEILKSQNAISSSHGGRRKTAYAFTEHGALMAANVLRSKKANQTSVLIIRAFTALRDAGKQQRELLDKILAQLEKHGSKIGQHDAEISGIVKFLTEIMKMQRAEKKFLN